MRRNTRFSRHENTLSRPVPVRGVGLGSLTASYRSTGLNGSTLIIGTAPQALSRCFPLLKACWVVLDIAESGADASNNTQFEFRIGPNLASYTTLATITTAGNPAAGEPMVANIAYFANPGDCVFVVESVNGTGTTNFNNADIVMGVDYRQERWS